MVKKINKLYEEHYVNYPSNFISLIAENMAMKNRTDGNSQVYNQVLVITITIVWITNTYGRRDNVNFIWLCAI